MNEDIEALNGRTVEVEQVTVTEDADGIPSWIKVDRELAGVVIVPSLLVPPAARQQTPAAPTTPASTGQDATADQTDSQDDPYADALHRHQEGASR